MKECFHINQHMRLLIIVFACLISAGCSQQKWIEGTHYKTIETAPAKNDDSQIGVKEYFSFWCPHCYQAEPFMKQLSATLPKHIAFEKVHVNFMGFVPKETQNLATLSLMVARENGIESKFSDALFNAIHVEDKALSTIQDFAHIYATSNDSQGSDLQLAKMASESSVTSLEAANNKSVNDVRQFLSGVPSLVVNDKYVLVLSSGLTLEEVNELITWLSSR